MKRIVFYLGVPVLLISAFFKMVAGRTFERLDAFFDWLEY